jgi:hypothetical protein
VELQSGRNLLDDGREGEQVQGKGMFGRLLNPHHRPTLELVLGLAEDGANPGVAICRYPALLPPKDSVRSQSNT